jgi:hypothetical protein
MAVAYETIRQEVERLRDYVGNDLNFLINQNAGVNYLAAALITCACDAISYLKYGRRNQGHLVFAEIVPDLWKPVAGTVYSAIRNGIIHVYETKIIVLGPRRLDIVVSWSHRPHFHVSSTGTDLYVNIQRLAQDLKAAVAQFEQDLKATASLRETFYLSMRREREITPADAERKKWQDVLSKAPQEAA